MWIFQNKNFLKQSHKTKIVLHYSKLYCRQMIRMQNDIYLIIINVYLYIDNSWGII